MTKKNHITEHYFASSPTSELEQGLIRTCLRGISLKFLTASSVFSKKRIDRGTRLLIDSMFLPESGCVLDLGCGYGAVGITAAMLNPALRVILTDVNMRAIGLTRDNIMRNKSRNAEVRYGSLYEPVKDIEFNCILSNPPVSAGMETVKAIVNGAPTVMAENATFQMVIRSKIGAKTLPIIINEAFDNCEVLARKSGYRVLIGKKH